MRAEFYESLTGKNIADIDAYWARLRYSGRATPPQALEDSKDIIEKVSKINAAIAYLPQDMSGSLKANGLTAVLTMENP